MELVLEVYEAEGMSPPEVRDAARKVLRMARASPTRRDLGRLKSGARRDARIACALSARESEILLFLADGFTSKEMATRLDLAEGTVRAYRKNLYRKLNASTRASAIASARTLALI